MVRTWRTDIEGLRAIAVLAVLLFHFDRSLLPGGYLGVDLFLAISGYLITQMLLEKEYLANLEGLGQFLKRRFLRTYPTLIIALPLTALVFSFLLLPTFHQVFFHTGAAALFGFTNILLARLDLSYFAPDTNLNPFLHSWSLSLEDQFYLLYSGGLFVLAGFVSAKGLRRGILGLAIVTGALAFLNGPASHGTAFYSLRSRLWEFSWGGLTYLAVSSFGAPTRHWGEGLMSLGFGGVLLAFAFFEEGASSNLHYSLFVASACLLLYGGSGVTTVGRLLSLKPLRFIGLISFSLYIYHFPLVKLFHLFGDVPLHRSFLLCAYFSACLCLAWLNHVLIERRFIANYRNKPVDEQISFFWMFPAVGLSACVVVELGCQSHYWSLLKNYEARLLPPVVRSFDGGGERQLVVYGDSHAKSLFPMFQRLSDETGLKIVNRTGEACLLATDMVYSHRGTFTDECRSFFSEEMKAAALTPQPNRTLFFGMRSLAYLSPRLIAEGASAMVGIRVGERFVRNEGEVLIGEYRKSLTRLMESLRPSGQRVIFLAPLPEMKLPTYLCLFHPEQEKCVSDRALNEAFRGAFMKSLREVAARFEHFEIWDPFDRICSSEACANIRDGRIQFRDDNHLSSEMALALLEDFQRTLGPPMTR